MRVWLGLALWLGSIATAAAQEDGARLAPAVPEDGARLAPALTRPPEWLAGEAPVYPAEAVAARLEADVRVRLHVDAEGYVTRVEVPAPSGHGFDDAARAAAMTYRFRPAEWDGAPGPIIVETTIHFAFVMEQGAAAEAAPDSPDETARPAAGVAGAAAAGADAPPSSRYVTLVTSDPERSDAPRHTLANRELTSVPGTFNDPLRAIQSLPGLARVPYALGVLLVRGTGPGDSGVYVDGHEVPILYHFLGGPSILNPELLDRIDLYPGGFPARFGRHLGGVVEVHTRAPAADGFHGAADVDLLDASVVARGKLAPRVTLVFGARRSLLDAVLPALLPDPEPGAQLAVVPVYWDAQARLDVDLPGRDELSVSFLGSDDRLRVLQADTMRTVDLRTHIGFSRAHARYVTRVGTDGRLVLTLAPVFGVDAVTVAGGAYSSVDVRQRVLGLRQSVVGPLAAGWRLDAGFDLEHRVGRYEARLPVATDVDAPTAADVPPELRARTIDAYGLGAWIELGWDASPRLRLVPALRADTYLLAGEPRASIDPRLGARFQTNPTTALSGYVGTYHQAPRAELFDAQLGNPRLGLETAVHGGVGVEHQLSSAVSVRAEVYYATRRDLGVAVSGRQLLADGTVDPERFASEGTGHGYGVELLVRHEVTRHFFGWVSYTLARAEQRLHPGDAATPTAFDQLHHLAVVGSWRLGRGWEVGGRFRLVSGTPETPVIDGTYDVDADAYTPVLGPRRSARRSLFHQLDLRVERRWRVAGWDVSAYLDLQNAYDAENAEATQWDYRFRGSRAVRGLPVLPTLGLKVAW